MEIRSWQHDQKGKIYMAPHILGYEPQSAASCNVPWQRFCRSLKLIHIPPFGVLMMVYSTVEYATPKFPIGLQLG